MASTLSDFGRHSERFGNIAFFYAFPIKFWFGQSMLVPEDVLTWCRENCTGYYKVTAYTHEDSKRDANGKTYQEKIMYVDKIYLSSEDDAAIIKLSFDVRSQQVKRPKLKRVSTTRTPKADKVLKPTDPVAIAAATRAHAAAVQAKAVAVAKKPRKSKTPAAPDANQLSLI